MDKKPLDQIFTVPFEFVLSVWGDPDINLVNDATRRGFFAVWALCNREYTDAMNHEISKKEIPDDLMG